MTIVAPTGIFTVPVSDSESVDKVIHFMDRITNDWTNRAARGECEWICASCCQSFSEGMPDACAYGHQSCTDIITRDKAAAVVK